ncbi:twin-arginine translocase subunit TatC [Enhydrobacter sp.]|uniref:twin-arginine translocase subunit TatC n=1 Tax=Enhydrobacter sp. TaxID=1894999 RepID=UPI00261CB0E5|nr:twin-arginine translocase subunit TatC [Enhydrobacter sp.]WIM12271.1 MAG: Twin-arginine translocation protein TatC [Enhydrobacter sp.]
MPLLDHLIELRKRLIYALISFFVVFFVTFYFAKPIFSFLIEPAKHEGYRLIVLDIFEFFFVTVKLSGFVALIVGFPLIATQIWLFVAPGLYRHEKRAFLPFLIATPFMFYAGCAIMYYVVLPYVINFMLTQYAPPDIEKTLRSSDYLQRILQLVFAFGFAFEMPVLLTLLMRVGILSSATLKSKRRYAIVLCFIVAAVLAPPDVVSQLALAAPLLAFYEISILLGGWIEKKREEEDKKAEQEATADS